MYKVTFNNKSHEFFDALKASVDKYFQETGQKKTGNWKLYLKTAILVPSAIAMYVLLLTVPMHWAAALAICGVLGFVLATIGFNVMHDACHGSYSTRSWVNDFWGLSNNALGGNAFLWKLKHNIVHHTYTNIDGVDDDINNMPFMRECETQAWKPMHRFQGYYMFLLYGLTSLFIFFVDFIKYFQKKVYTTPLKPMSVKEHVIFWVSKIVCVFVYGVLPISIVGWGAWALGFFVMNFMMGLTLAVVFQLAHVVEHAEFEVAGDEPVRIENEWAIHQIKTTANFAAKNPFATWFLGGLNFQIEHHLFPRIRQVHYPESSLIVRETCDQFGLRYNYFPTVRGAVASHFRIMNGLGKRPLAMAS